MIKNNCYTCKHRGNVPGDAHSCCRHPDLKGLTADIGNLIDLLASMGGSSPVTGLEPIQVIMEKFEIRANAHGVRQGWFLWPFNFDPVWLENCNAYEKKGQANGEKKDDHT